MDQKIILSFRIDYILFWSICFSGCLLLLCMLSVVCVASSLFASFEGYFAIFLSQVSEVFCEVLRPWGWGWGSVGCVFFYSHSFTVLRQVPCLGTFMFTLLYLVCVCVCVLAILRFCILLTLWKVKWVSFWTFLYRARRIGDGKRETTRERKPQVNFLYLAYALRQSERRDPPSYRFSLAFALQSIVWYGDSAARRG